MIDHVIDHVIGHVIGHMIIWQGSSQCHCIETLILTVAQLINAARRVCGHTISMLSLLWTDGRVGGNAPKGRRGGGAEGRATHILCNLFDIEMLIRVDKL
jgi:hypothetical protein